MPQQSLTWFLDVVEPTLPAAPAAVPARDDYTTDEVSEAVGKLVQGAIRRPYGILGQRQTGTTFDDTMDAAAGVFILTPEAPFYVLSLGSRRLIELLTSYVADCQRLVSAIDATGRRVRPVTNLTALGNARAALAALETASTQRDSTFSDIEDVTAFQRFDQNTSRFLAQNGKNIRLGENIVQTPQQAKKQLGPLARAVKEALAETQRRVGLLVRGIDDYNALNLPALLAQGVIAKAKSVLDERIEQLEGLTPTARLEVLRETMLDVMAGKAVVRGFGSLPKSGTFVALDGSATPFADADHPGTAAVVESELLDPYVVIAGADQLTFTPDGGPTTMTVSIQRSFLARLEGTIPEPFIINGTNDSFRLEIHPAPDLNVPLTNGTRTAAQIVADINGIISSHPIVAETFLAPEKFFGTVDASGAADPVIIFTKPAGSTWSQLGVEVGDYVIVQTGSMAQVYFEITVRGSLSLTCTRSGPGAAVNATGIIIQVGPEGRFVRVRVTEDEAEQSLLDSLYLLVEDDDTASPTLGIFPGSKSTCRRTTAVEVANSINASSTIAPLRTPRVSASAVFVGSDLLAGRTEPTDPSRLVSSIFRTTGDITNIGPTPARFAVAGALTAGVVVGNILTLRSAATAGQVGLRGTITLVTDVEVRANMNGSVSLVTGIDLEFGLALNLPLDRTVRVASPSPNAGDYRVLIDESNPTEATLDRPFATYYGLGGQPVAFEFQHGAFRVDFASTSTLTSSALTVTGTAIELFFETPPAETGVGSSRYVLLEEDPKVLAFGDLFEVYTGQYDVPEHSFSIVGFERGQQLLELDGDLPNEFVTLSFESDTSTPFARIRKLQRNNYDELVVQLGLWQVLPVNDSGWAIELDRLLNPLLVNDNPTLSATNTAKVYVQTLVQALEQLQLVLGNYSVDPVPRVDTLVESFLDRGSDRAVDTLLEGRFQDFFGYNSEEVSYLGNALERIRDVSRLDLPVRKAGRKELREQQLTLGQFEDPDFEFDQSDTRDVDEPDIPGAFLDVPNSSP